MAKRHRDETSIESSRLDATTSVINPQSYDSDSVDTSLASRKAYRPDTRLILDRFSHPIMTCNFLPNCNQRPFGSYAEFESHYLQQHTNRCLECHRNFPSEKYLQIHIAENHDVFVELKRESGNKTYQCFVEGCDRMCSTPQKRRLHLIDKHGFPKDFYFRVVDFGIDNCTSLLKPLRPPKDGHKDQVLGNPKSSRPSGSSRRLSLGVQNGTHQHSSMEIDDSKEVESTKKETTNVVEDGPPPQPASGKEEMELTPRSALSRYTVMSKLTTPKASSSKGQSHVDELSDMMMAVKLVPRSVRFGRHNTHIGGLKPK